MGGNVAIGMAYENDLAIEVAGLLVETDDVGQLTKKTQVVLHYVRTWISWAYTVAALV